MKRLKRENGITLIALIITIIVMLILVGVTITVAIDGGLISTTMQAKEDTLTEMEKEKLWMAAMSVIGRDGKVDFTKLDVQEVVKNEFEGSNGTYTGKETGKTYLVYEDGRVVLKGESEETDFEVIERDLASNAEKYLEEARTLGQETTTDVAIGTDGEVVNLDLWLYQKSESGDNTAIISTEGCGDGAYIGEITEDGKIQGTIPQLIYSEGKTYKVTSTYHALIELTDLKVAPAIPSGVTDASMMFAGCTSLTEAPTIPSSVTNTELMFAGCASLSKGPAIPSSVTKAERMFTDCTKLTQAPTVPGSVTNAYGIFRDCTSLAKAPTISEGVIDASNMFAGCTSLTEAPTIPTTVTDARSMFNGCTSLTKAPVIPYNVTDGEHLFSGCTSLTGEIIINANSISYWNLLQGVGSQTNPIVLKGTNTTPGLEAIRQTGNAGYITIGQ